jgi:hypothetical protein
MLAQNICDRQTSTKWGGRVVAWRVTISALALMLTMPTTPASADVTTVDADLRCLVASLTLLNSPVEEQRRAGMGSFSYWLGRVDGGAPNIDLEERIAAVSQSMTQEDVARELIRCGAELMQRGREVQAIGNRLQERGL